MSEFVYVVGDTFEGGPIELQKYIHEILSVGGEFEYAGNLVTLTRLPESVGTVDEIVANTIAAIEDAQLEASEVTPEEPAAETLPTEAPVSVAEVEKLPAKRGRKPATATAEEITE